MYHIFLNIFPYFQQGNHSHDLEHSLHQLLRRQHSKNINHEGPCLSSAPVGISKRRRLAGPRAADRRSLLEMATQKTLLEQIIQQAQHVVLRYDEYQLSIYNQNSLHVNISSQ